MRVLFDITRLVWRARRAAPSGIDRVVLAYGEWLQAAPDIEIVPVSFAGHKMLPVPLERFAELLASARASSRGGSASEAAWQALTARLGVAGATGVGLRNPAAPTTRETRVEAWRELGAHWRAGFMKPAPGGALYVNVAHAGLEDPALLPALAARGIPSAVMIHDLIPVTHPEFCTPVSVTRHAARMEHVLAHAGLIIANSSSTAEAVRAYASSRGEIAPRIVAAPLGLEPPFLEDGEALRIDHPYFVCVGAIEARKNLAFLLTVWRRLAEEMGKAAPRLVLVGPRGWENEAVLDLLERSPPISALVHETAGLDDARLAQLMRGARALLAPSQAEGYDLPLMEALSLGAPAIASDIPVHRELAQGAQLIDPLDGPAWMRAIRAHCDTPRPPAPRRGVSWSDHFERVGPHLQALGAHG